MTGERKRPQTLVLRSLKVMALGSPAATRQSLAERPGPVKRTCQPLGEIHGFAPLPRGRFALIVCNHRFAKDHRRPTRQRTTLIKQYLTMPVKN
jgi:hypothetical protein